MLVLVPFVSVCCSSCSSFGLISVVEPSCSLLPVLVMMLSACMWHLAVSAVMLRVVEGLCRMSDLLVEVALLFGVRLARQWLYLEIR